jgi:AcrR family transcriptional regulator
MPPLAPVTKAVLIDFIIASLARWSHLPQPAATGYRPLANGIGDGTVRQPTIAVRGRRAYRAGQPASSLLAVTDALWTPDGAPADRVRRLPVTRAAVRDAALRLFAERGYQLTTMVDIGSALGIRGPSLYKHVASKQELLAEIMKETMTTLIARQQAAVEAGGSPDVQLRRAVEAHVRYHATHREHALVGNREIESLDEPTRTQVVELRSAYEHGLRAIIERGCAAGTFSTAHPQLVSYAILDMGMGLSSWYRTDGEYDVDTLSYAYANLAAQMAGVPIA